MVLVSPIAFRSVDWDRETLTSRLVARQQVEQSPSIATDQPVSRQQEEEYSRYYGYPYYWDELGLWGADMYPRMAYLSAVDSTYGATATEEQPTSDPHLRSAREVTGYAIQARDGDLGHVEDFIVDDESWVLRYMVVDTRNWWPGKHVLVSPRWIESVRWPQSAWWSTSCARRLRQAKSTTLRAAQSGGRDQAPPGSPARAVLGGDIRRVIPSVWWFPPTSRAGLGFTSSSGSWKRTAAVSIGSPVIRPPQSARQGGCSRSRALLFPYGGHSRWAWCC